MRKKQNLSGAIVCRFVSTRLPRKLAMTEFFAMRLTAGCFGRLNMTDWVDTHKL